MDEHIKIYGHTPRIQYIADGILTTYEFPFAIFKQSDIKLYFGSVEQPTNTYQVIENKSDSNGAVVFSEPPQKGVVITIIRDLSIERTTDFQEGGTLRAGALNDELDYQMACQQQLADNLNRSMVLPPYAMNTNVNLTLPIPVPGKAIIWNNNGTNLENSAIEINNLESALNEYKNTALNAEQKASEYARQAVSQAETATNQAVLATRQAQLASQKVTEIQGLLCDKADADLKNLTQTGQETLVNCVFPADLSMAVDYTSSSQITIPSAGWLLVRGDRCSFNLVDSDFSNVLIEEYVLSGGFSTVWCPVYQGMCFSRKTSSSYQKVLFFPVQGV